MSGFALPAAALLAMIAVAGCAADPPPPPTRPVDGRDTARPADTLPDYYRHPPK